MIEHDSFITGETLAKYYDLNKKKKEIEQEMNQLKNLFHTYFDQQVGSDEKGEITDGGYKLQRQIRKNEKFNDEITVNRLEELKLNDLIKVVKIPDKEKISSAISLGLLDENDLEGCRSTTFTAAISVKEV
ncbi:hypothetical protein GCM10011409_37800 [Lentibacillus populi]|uniref:Uncharacterized protein n=1 Tax=Lentibacillus populi TaxID=1827502 RepID=A0A9W5X6Y7_9BACI|nr:hypothetical protein [Lentibacillus populi]MBT2218644.1 hypothetical protein [Virgibacillus dakarensis]GGB56663.1 hypothetical protein GCM10011409_37800 [Lentibacillus populi]